VRGYRLVILSSAATERWRPGDEIVWREVWRGTPWLVQRVRVVQDDGDLLVVHRPEGTRFEFPPGAWPWDGGHPWSKGHRRWEGHGPLILHRPGDAYTVQLFWEGSKRRFKGWYVNFQEPIRRTVEGFDTYDQELDIEIAPDGSWRVKDDELMEPWIERGRFTVDEVAAIRAEGARVVALLEAGERWWGDSWRDWRPDPAWTVP
jgi:hypothetical protein